MELSKNKASVEHRSRSIANIVDSVSMIVSVVFRKLKKRRRDGNANGKKAIGLDLQNSISARASSFFVHSLAVVARLQKHEKASVCFGK